MKKVLLLTVIFLTIIVSTTSIFALNSQDNLSNIQILNQDDFKFWGTMDTIKCGNIDMPLIIPSFIRIIINLIKIITPIVLIVVGMIDMVKATAAADEKKMTENKKIFVKRIISGVFIFLIVTILQFVIGIIAPKGDDSLLNCFNCMVNDAEKCGEITLGVPGEEPTSSRTPTPANPTSSINSPEKVLYIGDSRTVGMFDVVSLKSNENYIAKVSQGLTWYKNTVLSQIRSNLNMNDYYVVINLGVNDLYNVKKYAEAYNELANEYPKSQIIAVSVNPVEDSKCKNHGYEVRNNDVIDFNNTLKDNLNNKVYYCDVYSNIANDFTTTDGLHYTTATYKNIYSEIQKCLR